MKKIIFLAILLSFSANSYSGEDIVVGGKISAIANTNGNGEAFYLWINGGSGRCANSGINFPMSAAGSEKIFERAYATALAAYMSGKSVTIHDYGDTETCNSAAYIKILN